MNSRISLLLRAKNISPAQLADELGVQRSGISHILNGRNKPSLDFIQKLIKSYPDVSISWLMFGTGPMMNPYPQKEEVMKENKSVNASQASLIDLFPMTDDVNDVEAILKGSEEGKNYSVLAEKENVTPAIKHIQENEQKNNDDNNNSGIKEINSSTPDVYGVMKSEQSLDRKIKRIVIFYSDKTFIEYFPGTD